jgi:glycosyltransferase involved in cell wall biosynthesis
MRVLYLAQHQQFSGDHAGFAHAYNLTRALAAQGENVTLVARKPDEGTALPKLPGNMKLRLVEWELEYPLPFGPAPRIPKQLNVVEHARTLRWLTKLVREEKIQIIQERHEMRMDMSPLSTRFLGIPSVLEVNSPFIEEAFEERSFSFRSRNFFRRLGFDNASAIVVQTRLLRDIILKQTKTPIHVIPNGADPDLFSPAASDPGLARRLALGNEVIGFAGAFHPWHGAQDLVEAFGILAPKRPEARLLMIGGGGEELEKCRRFVSEKGLEGKVVFTGKVPYDRLPVHLKLCSVLVAPFSPSRDARRRAVFERYGLWWCPLKIFEYMAMGKPVVSSEVGVIPEYIEGAGMLYPEGDIPALADRLSSLLSDGALRENLGAEGRRKVEKEFNWAQVARRTAKLYRELLGRPAGKTF